MTAQSGYLELLRGNRDFRLLWLGTLVSLFGDWFNTIAVYTLVERLTGSPFAMGVVFVIKMAGFALASPPAGIIADRLDRRRLMIACDLLRAALVPLFLLVEDAGDVWLLYITLGLQVVLGATYDPAFRAAIPNVCAPRELLTANAIFSVTWSTLLALGAAVGGLATSALGIEAVFLIDSATYLVSAVLVSAAVVPRGRVASRAGGSLIAAAHADFVAGWRYLIARPRILRTALAKSLWGAGGGALVYLLTQLGEAVTPTDVAVGIGVFFSARGVGTGIGPIIARAVFRDRRAWLALMGASVVFSGVAYLVLSLLPWGFGLVAFIVVAHAASGANWVLSTVVLQEQVDDAFRGRVFATEMFLLFSLEAIGILVASVLLEAGIVDLAGAIATFALVQILSGAGWLASMPRRPPRRPPRAASRETPGQRGSRAGPP